MAYELSKHDYSILLIESGDFAFDNFNDGLKNIEQSGLPIKENSRERIVGGNTTTWGGLIAPLDKIDLEAKDWIEDSGWPIDYEELIQYCANKDIRFLSTAFDHDSIDLLAELDIPLFKIPSGEITNLPYLRHIGRMGKPIIMSTGMATLEEVRSALNILLKAGAKKDKITILHCNTEYPTPMEDVNMKAMLTMADSLGVNIGYSDHTLGFEVSIAAVVMGATVIEKHFTLDRNMPGPDHAASLEPDELKELVCSIRNIEKVMGDGIKKPSPSEEKNIPIARKSIVAKKPIELGELFLKENLTVKRPGTGISPMEWDTIINQKSNKNYQKDDLIEI